MDAPIFPWIKDDVAIEIIGKMIAEQVAQLNNLLNDCAIAGFRSTDEYVLTHPDYVAYMQRIRELNEEINQIYRGDNMAAIHQRVEKTYAPYLKGKYSHAYVKL